jgi:hypothetical protein
MEAQKPGMRSAGGEGAAIAAHTRRMRELLRVAAERAQQQLKPVEAARIKAYVAEGEMWAAQASTGPSEQPPARERREGTGDDAGPGKDPRSRQILAKLEDPISMSFANETPLDDVLKYIKQATTTKEYSGIQIYVDPIGLQEAERSLNSAVTIDLDGVPLRRTLQLVLAQLGLVYFVEDGMLYITSESSQQIPLLPSIRRPSRLMERLDNAEKGESTVEEMKDLLEVLKARIEVLRLKNEANSLLSHGEGNGGDAVARQGGPNREQIDSLLKEIRELIGLMKAERQGKKPAEVK